VLVAPATMFPEAVPPATRMFVLFEPAIVALANGGGTTWKPRVAFTMGVATLATEGAAEDGESMVEVEDVRELPS
jgi:hypothetical protein